MVESNVIAQKGHFIQARRTGVGRKGFYYVSSDNSRFSSARAFWAMDGDFINYGIRSLNVIFKFGLIKLSAHLFNSLLLHVYHVRYFSRI